MDSSQDVRVLWVGKVETVIGDMIKTLNEGGGGLWSGADDHGIVEEWDKIGRITRNQGHMNTESNANIII